MKGRPEALAALATDSGPAGGEETGAGPAKKGKKAKRAAKKEKAREHSAALRDDDEDVGFSADLKDPRFNGMVTDHEFALDPTDPR